MVRILFSLAIVIFAACSAELPHEASFDPNSPAEKQAKATLTVQVLLEGETDFSQVTVEAQNDARTYSIDTDAQGNAKLTGLVPGTYRLSLRTRYFEPVTQDIAIDLAETRTIGPLTLRALRSDVVGSALIERLVEEERISGGGASLTLRKTGSIRSGATGAPAYRAAATKDTATLQTVSTSDGSYTFSGVAVGTYELIAAGEGVPSLTIPGVQVTGDGTVVLDEVVLSPVTGFFKIAGARYDGTADYAYTATSAVTLELLGVNAPQMQLGLSSNGSASGCVLNPPVAYAELRSFDLGAPEGLRTVCVQYLGQDGTSSRVFTRSIFYDKTTPAPVVVTPLASNGYVTTDYVLVNLAAVDGGSGVADIKLGTTTDIAAAATLPFQPTLQVPLGGDGAYTRYLWVRDAVGNPSAMYTLAVTVDTQPPAAQANPFSINGGATVTNATQVVLSFNVSGATRLQVSEDSSFNGTAWLTYAPTKNFVFSSGDGMKRLFARVADDAGNIINLADQSIELDTQGPAGVSVSLAGGAELTNGAAVNVALTATGASWAELSQDAAFSSKVRFAMTGVTTYTFGGGDGLRTLYARFQDAAGNYSATVADTVEIDRSPPELPSLRIWSPNGAQQGESVTKDQLITLALSAVGAYELAVTDGTACGTDWESFKTTKSWTLPAGDGEKWVSVVYRDQAGNATACISDNIELDQTAPVVNTALTINGGGAETNDRLLSVEIDVSGATEMQLSESSSFAGASWQPFTTATTFILGSTDGSKTVWARYRDPAGNVSLVDSGTIWLDRTPPDNLTVTIVESSPANVTAVTLSVSATGVPIEMQISDNIGFVGAMIEAYATGRVYELPTGDGLHTVYVKVRDAAGNWSALASASIVIDAVAPAFASFTIEPGEFTRDTNVSIRLSADNAAQVQAQEGAFCGGSWAPMSETATVALSLPDGTKEISVRYRDAAGNETLCLTKSVILDTTDPTGSLVINAGVAETNDRQLTLTLTSNENPVDLQVSESVTFSGAAWTPFTDTTGWMLSAGEGTRRVYARLRDQAGNVSASFYDEILIDTAAPTDPSISLAGGANLTNQTQIGVSAVATGADYVRVANSASFSGASWLPYPASLTNHALTAGDGLKTVYAQFKDEAGNLSAVVSDTIVKDTQAPVDVSLSIAEAPLTNQATVTAVLSASGADEVQLVGDIVGGSTGWLSNRTSVSVALSAGDGPKQVTAQWRDLAGNLSAIESASVTLDQAPPADGSVAINASELTNNPNVTLNLTYGGDAVEMMISNASGFVGAAWEPVSATVPWTLPSGDGTKTVYVKYRDEAGNPSNAINDTIVLDTTPPASTSFTIVEGTTTGNTRINLSLSAVGATQFWSANTPAFSDGAWRTYAAAATHDVPAGDALKVVYVKFRDAAANESATLSQVITLDTGAPAGPQIVINAGAAYTKDTSVTLNLNAGDAAEMAFSDDGVSFGAWEPFAPTKGHTLPGTDGTKTVWVKYRDVALNETAMVSDDIILDRQAPTGTSIVIANGDPYTRNQTVILTLGATGATWMQVSEDNSFSGMAWESFAGTKQFVLSNGQGAKTVYARFKDEAGWVTGFVSDDITFDSIAPGNNSFAINGGASYTNITEVTLAINTNDATAEMRVNESSEFSGAGWETLAYARTFTLSTGDGTKTVYLQLRDPAGNETGVLSRSISLDTQAPANTQVSIDGNAAYATALDGGVTLSLSANDAHSGVAMVRLSNTNGDGDLDGATAVGFTQSQPWTLEPNGAGLEGTRTVYAKFVDGAGNETPVAVAATIFYDTQAPSVGATPIAVNGGAAHATSTFVELAFDATDAAQMMIGNEGVFTGAVWETYRSNLGWYLQSTQGERSVAVKFRDAAGNETMAYTAAITLDTQTPTTPSLSVAGGSGYVTSTTITLNLSAANADYVQVSADGIFEAAPLEPYATSLPFTLSPGDGAKAIYVRFCDEAGNCTDTLATTVVLDTVAPTGSVVVANGATHTRDITVNVAVSAADSGSGIEGLKLAHTEAALATTNVVSFEATKVWTLGGASGDGVEDTKWVWMQAVDRAGWSSAPVSDTITYDRLAPAGGISLSAAVTNQTLIGVNFTFSADTATMKLSNGNACAGGNWIAVSEATLWTIPNFDATHHVSVRFRDTVYNESTCYSATVVLDTQGPVPNRFVLTGAGTPLAGYSDSASITVDYGTAAADCAAAEFAEDVGFISVLSAKVLCSDIVAYTFLNAADGFKNLYLRYLDDLGNVGPVTSATIVVDSSVPAVEVVGGFTVAQGEWVKDPNITLNLSASGATRARYGEGGSCAFTVEPYTTTKSLTLSGGNAPKTVSVQYLDDAGNQSACYARTVTLDTFIGAFSVSLEGHDGFVGTTASQAVTVSVNGVDATDVVEMRVSNVAGFTGASWEPLSTSFTWVLPTGDGTKNVFVSLRDRASNQTDAAGSVVLDETPPDAPALQVFDITGDGFAYSSSTIELQWSEPTGAAQYELERLVNGLETEFSPLAALSAGTFTYTDLAVTPGFTHTYRIRAIDDVGNASQWSIVADASPFEPIQSVGWIRQADQFEFVMRPKPGAFTLNPTHYSENVTTVPTYNPLVANVATWLRPIASALLFDERLDIRQTNQDSSLVYDSAIELPFTKREAIGNPYILGAPPSIAMDAEKELHVAYGSSSIKLMYMRTVNGVWSSPQQLDSNSMFGGTSTRVDHDGNVHIAYTGFGGSAPYYHLRYATNAVFPVRDDFEDGVLGAEWGGNNGVLITGSANNEASGSWSLEFESKSGSGEWIETGDLTALTNIHYSLHYQRGGSLDAPEATDHLYVEAYVDASWVILHDLTGNALADATFTYLRGSAPAGTAKLRLRAVGDTAGGADYWFVDDVRIMGKGSGNTWTVQTADPMLEATGLVPSLDVDQFGQVHISFYNQGLDAVRYATNDTIAWTKETIEGSCTLDSASTLQIDALGRVNVGYVCSATGARFRRRTTSGWGAIEAVGPSSGGGKFAMVLKDGLHAHACYRSTGSDPMYAVRSPAGVWSVETVEASVTMDSYCAVGLAKDGSPFVAYNDSTEDDAFISSKRSGSWVPYPVNRLGETGIQVALVMDPIDRVHMISHNKSSGQYDYVRFVESDWTPWSDETAASTGSVGRGGESVVDSLGVVHAVHFEGNAGDLMYSSRATDGVWSTSTLDSVGIVGISSAVTIDAAGDLHVCYYDLTNKDLKFISKVSGSWGPSATLVSVDEAGENCDIKVGADGTTLHVTYFNGTPDDVEHIERVGGVWSAPQKVGDTSFSQGNSAVAIANDGSVHVVFQGVSGVLYRSRVAGVWGSVQTISGQIPYFGIDLAADALGNLHVAASGLTAKAQYYLTNASGAWSTTVLESIGEAGTSPSIAIDDEGKVHITSYRGDVLRYYTNRSGTWANGTLDARDRRGDHSTISFDANGRMHVTYYDAANLDLLYTSGYFSGTSAAQSVNLANPF